MTGRKVDKKAGFPAFLVFFPLLQDLRCGISENDVGDKDGLEDAGTVERLLLHRERTDTEGDVVENGGPIGVRTACQDWIGIQRRVRRYAERHRAITNGRYCDSARYRCRRPGILARRLVAAAIGACCCTGGVRKRYCDYHIAVAEA